MIAGNPFRRLSQGAERREQENDEGKNTSTGPHSAGVFHFPGLFLPKEREIEELSIVSHPQLEKDSYRAITPLFF